MFTKTQLTVNVCIISVSKTQLNPTIFIVYPYLRHRTKQGNCKPLYSIKNAEKLNPAKFVKQRDKKSMNAAAVKKAIRKAV